MLTASRTIELGVLTIALAGCGTSESEVATAPEAPPSGSVLVETQTTGEDIASEAYDIQVDGKHRQIGANQAVRFTGLKDGQHWATLYVGNRNCRIPLPVDPVNTVPAGADEVWVEVRPALVQGGETHLVFNINCHETGTVELVAEGAPPGSILSARLSGDPRGYVELKEGEATAMPWVTVGDHDVLLIVGCLGAAGNINGRVHVPRSATVRDTIGIPVHSCPSTPLPGNGGRRRQRPT